MTTSIADTPSHSRLSLLAWLPLAAIVAVALFGAVTGRAPVPDAKAMDIFVSGSYTPDISLDTSQCASNAGAIGDVLPGTDAWRTGQDATNQTCKLSFGTTNYPPGVNLVLIEDPAVAGGVSGDAMRCTSGGCAGDRITDYAGSGEPAAGTSAFGAQLLGSPGGGAAAVWAPAPAVNDVQDASDVACRTSATGTGDCTFTWGLTASASDIPGAYQAKIQSLAVAR